MAILFYFILLILFCSNHHHVQSFLLAASSKPPPAFVTQPTQRDIPSKKTTILYSSTDVDSTVKNNNHDNDIYEKSNIYNNNNNNQTYYGTSDEDFHDWFYNQITTQHPQLYQLYPHIFNLTTDAVLKWRKRYRGNISLWRKIFTLDRVSKELGESVPVIDAALQIINNAKEEGKKYTIVDLASGRGYMGMFLSEVLPPEKVEKIILIDKAWPMCNQEKPLPHQMNWDHIYGTVPNTTSAMLSATRDENASGSDSTQQASNEISSKTYFTTWPIPLHTSKQDLKQSCNQRQLKRILFDRTDGPIIIFAIHLCGTLSLKAIDMFNNFDNVSFLALKPCCLPPMLHVKRKEIFRIGQHDFDAKEVCAVGRFKGDRWYGPPRWHLEERFNVWVDHLYRGVDLVEDEKEEDIGDVNMSVVEERLDDGTQLDDKVRSAQHDSYGEGGQENHHRRHGKKNKFEVDIQVKGGFQNAYVFAERYPLTGSLWEKGAKKI